MNSLATETAVLSRVAIELGDHGATVCVHLLRGEWYKPVLVRAPASVHNLTAVMRACQQADLAGCKNIEVGIFADPEHWIAGIGVPGGEVTRWK